MIASGAVGIIVPDYRSADLDTLTPSSRLQPALVGVVTAFVGFSSSFAVVLHGLASVGASDAEAASGLLALAVAMGLAGVVLSLALRQPVSAAWSTPGAALLASTGPVAGGWPAAVGAFLIVGALLIAAGLVKPVTRAVAAIPASLANAMLAGVLFGLCLAPITALLRIPAQATPVVVAWLIVLRFQRRYATPAAALVAALVIGLNGPSLTTAPAPIVPHPLLTAPMFSLQAAASLAFPLFIVTMASQNLPGVAVLRAYGYRPAPSLLIAVTGVFSVLAAPFGGHAVNLSAITAAMCASPDASPDPAQRWIASLSTGIVYVLLGLGAGVATRFAAGSPILVEAVAGLALLAALGGALHNALAEPSEREGALATFLVAGSGVTIYGIGGAFWGLIAGGVVLILTRAGAGAPRAPSRLPKPPPISALPPLTPSAASPPPPGPPRK